MRSCENTAANYRFKNVSYCSLFCFYMAFLITTASIKYSISLVFPLTLFCFTGQVNKNRKVSIIVCHTQSVMLQRCGTQIWLNNTSCSFLIVFQLRGGKYVCTHVYCLKTNRWFPRPQKEFLLYFGIIEKLTREAKYKMRK